MPLTGDAAREFAERERARVSALKAERLEAAKADATNRGKEPFDLDKLETLCDTSYEGRMAPYDERFAEFERKYYVEHPSILTLKEFAAKLQELSRW